MESFEAKKAIAPVQWQECRAHIPMLLSSSTFGALAQLGERLICIQEVNGSIPLGSTKLQFVLQIGGTRIGSVAQVVRARA